MSSWWGGGPEERYWCEITDRHDIGADLKCPQTNETGAEYWSYSLIREVRAGDVVFHYSTPCPWVRRSVGGRSSPRRTAHRLDSAWHGGAGKPEERAARPGLWLPLYAYRF